MQVKCLEIRDEGTTISMLAIKPIPENEAQRAVLRHGGYGSPEDYVILMGAHDCEGSYNPHKQHSRTRCEAHMWIKEHWNELRDGDVVDVQFLRGDRPTPKSSEIQEYYSDAAYSRLTA
jgi:hypothetical protein